MTSRFACASTLTLAITTCGWSDVIRIDGLAEWEAATGPTSTITFTEYPPPGLFPITDEYAHLGVSFDPAQVPRTLPGSFLDGWGVSTGTPSNYLSIFFDEPITELAFVAPGFRSIRFVREGEVLDLFVTPGDVVTGFISDIAFDEVRFASTGGTNTIDDIHFSAIPGPAAPLALIAGFFACGSRRRD
ncbi:MAG: hypothetical protein AB8G96_07270 [Phycisphaerales bacterium]